MYELIGTTSTIVLALGVIIPYVIGYIINSKKHYVEKKKYLCVSAILIISFVVFSKIFEIILDKVYEDYQLNQIFNIMIIINFILCGYTFFGGYVGSILVVFAIRKKMQLRKEICFWFINNLNLMYAIMKIHCFLKGCCYGFTILPTQLLESMISFIIYITMIIIYKKSKKANMCTGLSIILFSAERFIISFYRAYMTDFAYIGTEVVCVLLMVLGSIIFLKNIKEKL